MRGEFFRFLLVGGAKTVFTYAVYLALLQFTDPYWSYIGSFVASIPPSYFFNLKFTFRAGNSPEKMVSYPLVLIAQFLVGVALLHLCLSAGVREEFAPLFSVAAAAPVGFFMTRWVIGEGKENTNPVLFLSLAALATSMAAVYGALFSGQLFPHGLLFTSDFSTTFLMWEDVRAGIFSFADWNLHKVTAPYILIDIPLMWFLYWIADGDLAAGMHIFGILMLGLYALAWMLVSDRVFGRNSTRRAFVFLLCALGASALSYGAHTLLGDFLFPTNHSSIWVLAVFCVFLFLCATGTRRALSCVFLFLLCLAGSASNPGLIVWFVAPAVAAAVVWGVLFRTLAPLFPSVSAVAGVLFSFPLRDIFIPSAETTLRYGGFGKPEHIAAALRDTATWAADAAVRHPLLAAVWVVFFVLLAVAIFKAVRSRKNTKPERLFVLLFLFFAPAASVAAAILTGNFFIGISTDAVLQGRYFLPAHAVPLFAGWAFLRFLPSPRMLAAGAAVVVAVCSPRALALTGHGYAFTGYYPPVTQCIDEGARRFNLKKGLSAYWWAKSTMATSKTGLQIAQIKSHPDPSRREQLWKLDFGIPNRFFQGPFDFVIANSGKYRPDQDRCEGKGPEECGIFSSGRDPMVSYILRPRNVVRHFERKPSSVFSCDGAQILVFNPPLQ